MHELIYKLCSIIYVFYYIQSGIKPSGDYNSIASLEELTINKNYRPYFKQDVDVSSAGLYLDMFAPVARAKGLQFPFSDLHINISHEIAALPDNESFRALDERLNRDLINYSKFLSKNEPMLANLANKSHRIVRVLPQDDPEKLPYKTENGIVQIYLANYGQSVITFKGADNVGRTFDISRKDPIVGETGVTHDVKEINGHLQAIAIPSRIFITADLGTNDYRYEYLLTAAIGEFTHSILMEALMRNFYESVRQRFGRVDLITISNSWKDFDAINESAVHAASALYMGLDPKNKSFVDARLGKYRRSPRYTGVGEYYDVISEAVDEAKLPSSLKPVIPLRLLIQGFSSLEQGKNGIRQFIFDNYLKK